MTQPLALLVCVLLFAGCDPAPAGPRDCAVTTSDGESGVCTPSQPILRCDVTNARDLGGIALSPSGSVACGALLRGPQLAYLTPRACNEVARLGIRTIVDLRVEGERLAKPDDPCVQANLVFAPLPIPFSVSPADYVADLDTSDSIARAFQVFADETKYPVYFHCTWGRDRTGVVAALVLLALGASRDDILREYLLSQVTVGAFPDSLAAVLDQVELRGGIDSALQAAGVSAAELAALRAHAILGRTDSDAEASDATSAD